MLYLWLKDEKLDRVAASAAEVGVLFTTVVLLTGPLWGKPIWGTWWTWDARLTLTLFLWFVGVGYLVLRGAVEEPGMRARFSAVLGILAALLVPFIHLSVYLFRTLHPMPVVLKPSAPSMPREMTITFMLAFLSFSLLFAAFLRARYRLAVRHDALLAREEATVPMNNAGYYHAAYAVAVTGYVAYSVSLWLRSRALDRRAAALDCPASRPDAS